MRVEHILGSINTQTVNVVGLDEVFDPRVVASNDVGELSVNIRKRDLRVTKPAVLFAGDVAEVDGAVRVVVGLVENDVNLSDQVQRVHRCAPDL